MKFFKMFLLAGLLVAAANAQVDTTKQHYWLMTYFINAEEGAGARFAFSSDSTGLTWQIYNSGHVFLAPTLTGADGTTLMRDPMMSYDSAYNKFSLVWTISWVGNTIGWDTSSNLKTWGPEVALPVGSTITSCYCCWAPEVFWDDTKGQWMILWSTNKSSSGDKNIYYATVPGLSFTKLSASQLLFNPGFTTIDADIMKVSTGKYMMVFKDERNSSGPLTAKNVHYVVASAPSGPWKGPKLLADGSDSIMSQACTLTGCEGPSIVKQGGEYHLFFDPYAASIAYRLVKVTNLDTLTTPWPNAGVLRAGGAGFTYNHSNVIEIPRRYVMYMLFNTPLPTPPAMPTLLLPDNGSGSTTNPPALSWSTVTGATGYNVQVAESSDFAAIVYGQGVASSNGAPSGLAPSTTYYWRVNASSVNAGAGTWSGVWSFTTSPSAVLPVYGIAKMTDFAISGGILAYSVIKAGAVEISFRDMLGRTALVIKRVNPVGEYTIDLKKCNLPAGNYIVRYKAAGLEKSAAVVLSR